MVGVEETVVDNSVQLEMVEIVLHRYSVLHQRVGRLGN
jgi:hypothetical protein